MRYYHGQVIRMYRRQRNMSQSELAERWPRADGAEGVNTRYVQDVEYGKKLISDPATLRKLATMLNIPLWSFGLSEYDPFQPTLQPDPALLAEWRVASATSLEMEQDHPREIPSGYYERMLRAYTQVEPLLFTWTMWNLGLSQLSSQIDALQPSTGNIAIFKCSPANPSVCSLYEIARHDLHLPQMMKLRFSGRESLAGQAVQGGKAILENKQCAIPIMRRGCVGACLVVRSQATLDAPDVEIIQRYADLFSLAFADGEFYLPRQIDLCTIPAELKQELLLQEFDLQRLDLVSVNITDPERIRQAEELILQSLHTERRGGVDVTAR